MNDDLAIAHPGHELFRAAIRPHAALGLHALRAEERGSRSPFRRQLRDPVHAHGTERRDGGELADGTRGRHLRRSLTPRPRDVGERDLRPHVLEPDSRLALPRGSRATRPWRMLRDERRVRAVRVSIPRTGSTRMPRESAWNPRSSPPRRRTSTLRRLLQRLEVLDAHRPLDEERVLRRSTEKICSPSTSSRV